MQIMHDMHIFINHCLIIKINVILMQNDMALMHFFNKFHSDIQKYTNG